MLARAPRMPEIWDSVNLMWLSLEKLRGEGANSQVAEKSESNLELAL